MLPTRDELQKRYASFSNDKLLSILHNSHEYTPEALEIAQAELANRKIDTGTIDLLLEKKQEEEFELQTYAKVRAHIPLTFFQKAFYFFAWFAPWFMAGAFRMNDAEDGYERKVRQSRNFAIAGMCSLFAVAFISVYMEWGTFESLLLILALFIAFYLVDDKLNSARKT